MSKKLLSIAVIATVAMLSIVSATDTPGLEKQSCIVSDTVYDQVTQLQLEYADALAANNGSSGQALYDEIQTLITSACGSTDGIVNLQTSGQTPACVTQVNQLLNYYTYTMQLGRYGIAASIRQQIQEYLTNDACESLLSDESSDDGLALQTLLQTTLSQIPEVIPYSSNICFLDNTVDNFVEQINNIGEQNVIQSVNTLVDGLFDGTADSGGGTLSANTQTRQNTILSYAKAVIQDRWAQISLGNEPVFSDLLTQYLAGLADTINGFLQSDGSDSLFAMLLHGPDLTAYYTALHTIYPSRDDFATALQTNPNITYTRDAALANFTMSTSDGGLQFTIPVTGSGSTGTTLLASYRYYDGIQVSDTDSSGEAYTKLLPTRIIGDIVDTADSRQKIAFDIQVSYDANNHIASISIDLYIQPYIVNITLTPTLRADGDTQIDAQMQLFGPATCNFTLQASTVMQGDINNNEDNDKHPYLSLALTATVNNGIITAAITDLAARSTAKEAYAQTNNIPDPIASASANPYFDGDVSIGGQHIADINADDNLFRIKFDDVESGIGIDLISTYINPLPLDTSSLWEAIIKIRALLDNDAPQTTEDTSSASGAVLTQCTNKSGENIQGYYYYADLDVMVSTYCLPAYDTCGTYNYTGVDDLDLYYRAAGKDMMTCYNWATAGSTGDTSTPTPIGSGDANSGSGTENPEPTPIGSGDANSGSGTENPESTPTGSGDANSGSGTENPEQTPDPIPGCTDPAATNYNTSATQDDGSCTYGGGQIFD